MLRSSSPLPHILLTYTVIIYLLRSQLVVRGEGWWNNVGYIEDCNGIAGIQDDGISVYPNPARGRVEVNGTDNCNHLELVNMLGVTVLSQKVAGSSIEIDVSRLARGTYLLRLHSTDGIATKRLIVQ